MRAPTTPLDHPEDSGGPAAGTVNDRAGAEHGEANHYRHMMEMSTVLGAIADYEGHFVHVTSGWRSVLGYSPERLVGTLLLSIIHADDVGRTHEQLQLLMSSGVETNNFEVRLRARDGSYRWILWNLRGDAETRQIYGVGYDMTERRLVEEELIDAREAALQASREKSRFLANMSHEIRTPMNGILGMTSMALATPLTSEQREFLQSVHQSGETLLAIINDILDISQIEARRMTLLPAPFALRDLLGDVMGAARVTARAKNLDLDIDVAADVPMRVIGDARRIGQVLRNLVSNAVKFTDAGGVRVRVSRDNEFVRFSVCDTGPGIRPEQHQLIFEPFRQADDSSSRRHGGTGLGLSISRELANMMGGLLSVESSVGQGATFHCLLPLPAVHSGPDDDREHRRAEERPVPQLGLHVLLAEDNPINARVATRILQRLGCRVTLAETGRRVLELIESAEDSFALILMDVQMPDVDGLEATEALRVREEEHGLPRMPVVAVTANAMRGDEERCLAAGMDGYLAKPITLETLECEIRRVTGLPQS